MKIIEDIINKEVIDSNANVLGTVADVEFDTTTNTLESLIIINKKGFNKSSQKESIPIEQVSRIGDKIIIKKLLDINTY